jgi:hypothetical protein
MRKSPNTIAAAAPIRNPPVIGAYVKIWATTAAAAPKIHTTPIRMDRDFRKKLPMDRNIEKVMRSKYLQ